MMCEYRCNDIHRAIYNDCYLCFLKYKLSNENNIYNKIIKLIEHKQLSIIKDTYTPTELYFFNEEYLVDYNIRLFTKLLYIATDLNDVNIVKWLCERYKDVIDKEMLLNVLFEACIKREIDVAQYLAIILKKNN